MSLPAATAAFTAAFINHAEPANDASIGVLSFMDTDQLSRTSMFLPETDIGQDYIQLAQVDGQDALRLLLCAVSETCRDQLQDRIQNPGRQVPGDIINGGNARNDGLRRVQDNVVQPSEIGDPRDITYFGDRQNNQGRWVSLWNVPVRDFGTVCAGTYDDTTHPTQSNMQIIARQSCDLEFSNRQGTVSQPPVEIDRFSGVFASEPGLDGVANFFTAYGGNDDYRFVGAVKLTADTYPVAVTARRASDNETGCFRVDSRGDAEYERIPDTSCSGLAAPEMFR